MWINLYVSSQRVYKMYRVVDSFYHLYDPIRTKKKEKEKIKLIKEGNFINRYNQFHLVLCDYTYSFMMPQCGVHEEQPTQAQANTCP